MSAKRLRAWFAGALEARLDERGAHWLERCLREVEAGLSDLDFAGRIALASRYAGRRAFEPSAAELAAASELVPGWNPERWSVMEATRAALVLARADLDEDSLVRALEECFRYADVGELCALYRSLALLPRRARFAWRAGEGCRSNMKAVFEAVACDSPLPAEVFDEIAWRQLVLKAVFVEAPLWRVVGLDGRLSEELARMALDLADERRSAGRPVQHSLWLVLGPHGGERARSSIERELQPGNQNTRGRRAAAIALARAGGEDRLKDLLEVERDGEVAATMRAALAGETSQEAFRALDPKP